MDLTRFIVMIWRWQWQPTPVLLPGKSHGQRSLVGYSPGGHEESAGLSKFTSTFHFHALEKMKRQPTPVFLPGESQGRGSLVGCRLWGRTESDTGVFTAAAAVCDDHITTPIKTEFLWCTPETNVLYVICISIKT